MSWLLRRDSAFPFQTWKLPFEDSAIVLVKNVYGKMSIGPVKNFWFGYEQDFGQIAEGVIVKVRRLDKLKRKD